MIINIIQRLMKATNYLKNEKFPTFPSSSKLRPARRRDFISSATVNIEPSANPSRVVIVSLEMACLARDPIASDRLFPSCAPKKQNLADLRDAATLRRLFSKLAMTNWDLNWALQLSVYRMYSSNVIPRAARILANLEYEYNEMTNELRKRQERTQDSTSKCSSTHQFAMTSICWWSCFKSGEMKTTAPVSTSPPSSRLNFTPMG